VSKWVDIDDLKGYKVSTLGEVKGPRGLRKLKAGVRGYVQLGVFLNGKSKQLSVHRLVAKAFISNPENKPQVNHKNGIKTDNRVENLEWATAQENMNHAKENNLLPSQSGSGSNVYDWAKVLTIHTISKKHMGSVKLAEGMNVKQSGLSLIRSGKRWPHLQKIKPTEQELNNEIF
jgi:hypothetical protein